jgi:hypothetical protein
MLNIIRSILRQIRKDKLLLFFGVYLLLMVVITFVGDDIEWDVSGSEFTGTISMFLQFGLPLSIGMVTTRACGADLRDKTANYEVLFGKKRWEVYLGRFIPSLLVALVLTAVIAAVPVLFFTVKNGWGGSLPAKQALQIFGVLFTLTFRMVCFYTAFTFLCGNDVVALIAALVGAVVLLIASALMKEVGYELTWHTALTDLTRLLDFTNTTSGFFNGKDITVYKLDLPASLLGRMVCTSFGIGSAWLLGGYAIFRKRDIP